MKKLNVLGLLIIFIFSCDIGNWEVTRNNSSRANYNAYEEVDFLRNAYPLTFGTSVNSSNSIIREGGYESRGPAGGPIPDDAIELSSVGNAGKIAGSEDCIAFLFKPVEQSKNFIMEADFKILRFGNGNNAADPGSNGQEGWGIMVRDFVPQFPGRTMEDWDSGNRTLGNANNYHVLVSGSNAAACGSDSNMVLAGGVKRGFRAYWRYGIKQNPEVAHDGNGNPTATGSQNFSNFNFSFIPRELPDYSIYTINDEPVMSARPDFPRWNTTVKVRLEKTNNGFKYRITPDSSDTYYDIYSGTTRPKPEISSDLSGEIPLYDITDSVNKNYYYVGLFSARDAVVQVTNISYWEADKNLCTPELPIRPMPIDAKIEVLSPQIYTGENYLYVKTNTAGKIDVMQNGRRIPGNMIISEWITEKQNGAADPLNLFTVPMYEPKDGENIFNIIFYPGELPAELKNKNLMLSSTASVSTGFLLIKKFYHNGTGVIYAGPHGTPYGAGTTVSPLDLQTAIDHCQPGQTIEMLDGKYPMEIPIVIPRYNNGRFNGEKILKAQNRDKVFLDWQKDESLQLRGILRGQAFMAAGSYWILDGFHVRGAPDKIKGLVINGHNNTIRYVQTYNNGDTGFQLSGSANEPVRFWPSGNIVEYCESFHNIDSAETDADGFAAKLTVGPRNEFRWCVSHHNNDDGWDLFAKKDTGPTGVVKITNSISYRNGYMLNGYRTRAGHNGFKMGGEGIRVFHEIRQCLSFANLGNQITSNSNPDLRVYDTTTVDTSGMAAGNINIYASDKSVKALGRAERVIAGAITVQDGAGGNVTTAISNTTVFGGNVVMNYNSSLETRGSGYWGEGRAGITNNGTVGSVSLDYTDFESFKCFLPRYPSGHAKEGQFMLGNLYRPPDGFGAHGLYE